MERKVWVIQSEQGFLKDINVFTKNPEDAVVFSCLQSAFDKFIAISGALNSECWINSAPLPFPRQQPYIHIHDK